MNAWEIFKAIKARFDASAALTAAVGGRLRFTHARQEDTLPYIVFSLVDSTHEWTNDTTLENLRIQFSVYSDDPSAVTAVNIHRLLTEAFDNVDLSIVGYATIWMWRESDRIFMEDIYWSAVTDYRLRVQVCATTTTTTAAP